MNQKPSSLQKTFNLVFTKTFNEEVEKETRGNKSLAKKLYRKLESLKQNPFNADKIENPVLPKWRVWIGNTHRLMYDIKGVDLVLLKFVKKSKATYK